MKKLVKNAKVQLVQLIQKLNKESNFLSSDEFISVLTASKSICTNKQFTEGLIQSLNVLKQTKIHHKDSLTIREQQVLLLIGEGSKSSVIATQLNLSKSTIETHRKNMRKKLKLNGKDNLFALALLFSVQYKNTNRDDNF
jgi:two-component system nitrate/nitrite response regulator NarL